VSLDEYQRPLIAIAGHLQQIIIQPAVEITPPGTIAVRDDPGFGYARDRYFAVREESIG